MRRSRELQVASLPFSQVGVKRVFLGHADDVEMDATSRVLIHPELRAWAGLEREVKTNVDAIKEIVNEHGYEE